MAAQPASEMELLKLCLRLCLRLLSAATNGTPARTTRAEAPSVQPGLTRFLGNIAQAFFGVLPLARGRQHHWRCHSRRVGQTIPRRSCAQRANPLHQPTHVLLPGEESPG